MDINDLVMDKNGNPVWCHLPAETKKWLQYRAEQKDARIWDWTVRLGNTMKRVTVQNYLKD